MDTALMGLKILLPYKVFAEIKNVRRIVMETSNGSYGMMPHRLDCVAAIVPGIFTYETETGGDQYIAMDEGILVKEGLQVLASVRNAIGGADLGQLRASVEKEFINLDEQEKNVRLIMEKMESGFIYNLEKFRKL
jgi:F-type H+-transporting ATPase subunit epsilon